MYVRRAHADGRLSRASYKLEEMNNELKIIKPGNYVLDLGAAPGGWTQIAVKFAVDASSKKKGRVLSVDINDMYPIEGSTFLKLDFSEDESIRTILKTLGGSKVDVVLSDMAPSYSGLRGSDHHRLMELSNRAFDIAKFILKPNGNFLTKISRGGTENEFVDYLKQYFKHVTITKPPSSRPQSTEIFVCGKGFRAYQALCDEKGKELANSWAAVIK